MNKSSILTHSLPGPQNRKASTHNRNATVTPKRLQSKWKQCLHNFFLSIRFVKSFWTLTLQLIPTPPEILMRCSVLNPHLQICITTSLKTYNLLSSWFLLPRHRSCSPCRQNFLRTLHVYNNSLAILMN